ncbi:MAG: DJ-1/PfpI family protein [Pseudomonadota bacterium]
MRRGYLGAALTLLLSVQNAAGIELIKSLPEGGAVLDRPLRSLQLWFDAPVDASTADVVIAAAEAMERDIEVIGLHTMGDNDLMALVEGPMPDGDYTLAWRSGGDRGEVAFTVKRAEGYVDDEWERPLDIGIVLYDGTEPLDVFGPLEMWMNAGPDNIRVHLIAEQPGPVALTTTSYPQALAPTVEARYSFDDHPDLDVLMVPGGVGTLVEADNSTMISFLQRATQDVALITSVCTGSGLLARAGVLEGVKATGNKAFFDYLVSLGEADWQPEARWVESGRFVTSSGVSAGIDMSLAVIARFFGANTARMIAASTEYVWNEDPEFDPFVSNLNQATPYVDGMRQRFSGQAGKSEARAATSE